VSLYIIPPNLGNDTRGISIKFNKTSRAEGTGSSLSRPS